MFLKLFAVVFVSLFYFLSGCQSVDVEPDSYQTSVDNTYWKLIELNGETVDFKDGQTREAYFQLVTDGLTVRGFGGCNNFSGRYQLNNDKLTFGPLMSTRMFCQNTMDLERQFLSVLKNFQYYSIDQDVLIFFSSNETPIARFKAVYFN